jgi:hypothetical protein
LICPRDESVRKSSGIFFDGGAVAVLVNVALIFFLSSFLRFRPERSSAPQYKYRLDFQSAPASILRLHNHLRIVLKKRTAAFARLDQRPEAGARAEQFFANASGAG